MSINYTKYSMFYHLSDESSDKPILVYLHGGPGTPDYHLMQYYKSIFTEFKKHNLESIFNVCYVELRGSGKSFKFEKDILTVEEMVNDVIRLAKRLKNKGRKIYLLGHSWGSIIGLKVTIEASNLFVKYIGIGQILNYVESEQYGFNRLKILAIQNKNTKDLQKIKSLEQELWQDSINFRKNTYAKNRIITKYRGDFWAVDFMRLAIKAMIQTKYYSFVEKLKYILGVFYSHKQLVTIEVSKQLFFDYNHKLPIPCLFIFGEYDLEVPVEHAKSWINNYQKIHTDSTHLLTISEAAHFPHMEKPKQVVKIISNFVD